MPSADQPAIEYFVKSLSPQQSGSGKVYTGQLRQRGFGLWSALRSVGNFLFPLVKSAVIPSVAPAISEFASGIASDISSGENLKRSLRARGKTALSDSARNLIARATAQKGTGKRKKLQKKAPRRRKIIRRVQRRKKKKTITFGRL